MTIEIRNVCDGFDVSTEIGVLHFPYEPTEEDVARVVESITAAQVVVPADVEAEDGTLV